MTRPASSCSSRVLETIHQVCFVVSFLVALGQTDAFGCGAGVVGPRFGGDLRITDQDGLVEELVVFQVVEIHERGREGLIVIEGEAVKLVPVISKADHPLASLYEKVKALGLIDAVCRACSHKLGVADDVEKEGLALTGDMSGHPSMGAYLEKGYEVIVM